MNRRKREKTTGQDAKQALTSQEEPTGVRLNVFLQKHGIASRRKADELIESRKVAINGKIVSQMGVRVQKGDKVTVDGKQIRVKVPTQTHLLWKPDQAITSRSDPQGRQTIYDLPSLRKLPRNVQAVGRLDYRSEGLLLLTNDGELALALTHPRFSVPKTYAVLLSDEIRPEEMTALKNGVELDDGVAKAVAVRKGDKAFLGTAKRGQWIEVVVTEGRNRIVRRMFEALGLKVIRLVRVGLGSLQLPLTMKPGDAIPLPLEQLKELVKMKEEALRLDQGKPSDVKPVRKRVSKLADEDYAKEVERRNMQLEQNRTQRAERIEREQLDAEKSAARKRGPAKNPFQNENSGRRPYRKSDTVSSESSKTEARPSRITPARKTSSETQSVRPRSKASSSAPPSKSSPRKKRTEK